MFLKMVVDADAWYETMGLKVECFGFHQKNASENNHRDNGSSVCDASQKLDVHDFHGTSESQ